MISYLIKFIAFIVMIIISPIIIFAMAIIFIEDGSPILFVQRRIGKNEKQFNIFKLRTMNKDTPNKGTHEISQNNYLRSGSILRKTKIDELPQVLNYLKGDINLIGPRPGLPSQHDLTAYRKLNNVFKIKPGITGLAQVLGYDMSNPKLLSEIDDLYIKKKSITLDINIFFATFIHINRVRIKNKFKNELKEIHDDI